LPTPAGAREVRPYKGLSSEGRPHLEHKLD
jgi:hypothetical protein